MLGAPGSLGAKNTTYLPGGTSAVKFVCPCGSCTVWTGALSKSETYTVMGGTNWLGKVTMPSSVPADTPALEPNDTAAASDKRGKNRYPKAATLRCDKIQSLAW